MLIFIRHGLKRFRDWAGTMLVELEGINITDITQKKQVEKPYVGCWRAGCPDNGHSDAYQGPISHFTLAIS